MSNHQRQERFTSLAEKYDRKGRVFVGKARSRKQYANAQAKLSGSEQRAYCTRPTENPEAQSALSSKASFFQQTHRPDLRTASDSLQSDWQRSELRLAYAGLAVPMRFFPLRCGVRNRLRPGGRQQPGKRSNWKNACLSAALTRLGASAARL